MDDRYYLEIALEEAEQASAEGTYPIGAVLVGPDGAILARGRNRVYTAMDPSVHAEIDVIRSGGPFLLDATYKRHCTIYSSVEPCTMCTGAIIHANIARVCWALNDHYMGALRVLKDGSFLRHKLDRIEVRAEPYHDLALRSQTLHRTWENRHPHPIRISHVEECANG